VAERERERERKRESSDHQREIGRADISRLQNRMDSDIDRRIRRWDPAGRTWLARHHRGVA